MLCFGCHYHYKKTDLTSLTTSEIVCPHAEHTTAMCLNPEFCKNNCEDLDLCLSD